MDMHPCTPECLRRFALLMVMSCGAAVLACGAMMTAAACIAFGRAHNSIDADRESISHTGPTAPARHRDVWMCRRTE